MTFLSKIAQIYPEIYTSGDAESLYIYAHTHVNVCENIKQEHIDKSNECILVIFYMVTHQLVHYLARFRGLLTEVKKCLPKYEPAPQEVRWISVYTVMVQQMQYVYTVLLGGHIFQSMP